MGDSVWIWATAEEAAGVGWKGNDLWRFEMRHDGSRGVMEYYIQLPPEPEDELPPPPVGNLGSLTVVTTDGRLWTYRLAVDAQLVNRVLQGLGEGGWLAVDGDDGSGIILRAADVKRVIVTRQPF